MIKRKTYNKYPTIQNGDKIKYLGVKQPNPLGCNVISFATKLPKELDIYKYIVMIVNIKEFHRTFIFHH